MSSDSDTTQDHCGHCDSSEQANSGAKRIDWIFWVSLSGSIILYLFYWLLLGSVTPPEWLHTLSHSVFELINTVWWGVAIGIVMIGVLGRIPREFVMSALGTNQGFKGILQATLAGVLLDLCNHGVSMVGAKLYERGASIGQVIAFLVSSPWNSFSLTLILVALIGLPYTLGFILLSMIIAVITGVIFDFLVQRNILPDNPRQIDIPKGFRFWREARKSFSNTTFSSAYLGSMLIDGIKDSRMVVRWILFGVLLASLIRAFIPAEVFENFFGPTILGLGLTIVFATILEVCSEGSTPIAADMLTRANAPGNSFAFLMGGVATDYTEIVVLRDTTKSWKVAMFLPLITLPQVIALGWLINTFAV